MTDFESDMLKLDEGLKALKIEFNRYFTGALDRPPYELQSGLEAIIRRQTANGSGRRTAEQFRFNSLVSRFHVLTEMWNRNVRNIEEGRPSILQRREGEDDGQRRPPEHEVFRTSLNLRDAGPDSTGFRDLYRSYLSAAHGGQPRPGALSYERFYDQVRSRMLRYQERTGADTVQFRLVLVDNRPLLKLRSEA